MNKLGNQGLSAAPADYIGIHQVWISYEGIFQEFLQAFYLMFIIHLIIISQLRDSCCHTGQSQFILSKYTLLPGGTFSSSHLLSFKMEFICIFV